LELAIKKSDWVLIYSYIFLGRRVIIGFITIFLFDYPTFQVICTVELQVFVIIGIGYLMPFRLNIDNAFEICNEFIVLNMTYFMVPLLGAYSSAVVAQNIGWVSSGLIVVFLIANIIMIMVFTIKSLVFNLRKSLAVRRYMKNRDLKVAIIRKKLLNFKSSRTHQNWNKMRARRNTKLFRDLQIKGIATTFEQTNTRRKLML